MNAMAESTQHNIKTLATRLLETGVIGGIIMYGVIQVLQTEMKVITTNQSAIVTELKQTSKEQARRTVIVEESWKHITDDSKHKH